MTAHAGATFMTLADTPERFNKTQCGLIVHVSILSAVKRNLVSKIFALKQPRLKSLFPDRMQKLLF